MRQTVRTAAFLSFLLAGQADCAETSSLSCKAGPVTKIYGKTRWLVYGCVDDRSMVIVTAPGNRASPFYFMLSPQKDGYHLTGEGTGDKAATDAAYRDLSKLSEKDIEALISETKHH